MIRTIVAATAELARASLADVVRGDARLALVAEASPRELDRLVRALAPDVVVVDRDDDTPGLLPSVTLVDDPHLAWLRARYDPGAARAILGRDATPTEIVGAIVAVAAGLVVVVPRALEGVTSDPSRSGGESGAGIDTLTAREAEVLGELGRGYSNKTIARRLRISEHTVKFHVASIFAKLGATSRTEAVAHGVRHGLIML